VYEAAATVAAVEHVAVVDGGTIGLEFQAGSEQEEVFVAVAVGVEDGPAEHGVVDAEGACGGEGPGVVAVAEVEHRGVAEVVAFVGESPDIGGSVFVEIAPEKRPVAHGAEGSLGDGEGAGVDAEEEGSAEVGGAEEGAAEGVKLARDAATGRMVKALDGRQRDARGDEVFRGREGGGEAVGDGRKRAVGDLRRGPSAAGEDAEGAERDAYSAGVR